jgi:GH25 family lysozyme M1 (1,4-beta-N-acetylmuramidase)
MQKGFDVSSNNHPNGQPIDWQAAYAFYQQINPGVKPKAWIKATEGTKYYNPWHALDVSEARSAGFDLGHYCYGRPSANSGAGEALTFLAAITGTLSYEDGDDVAIDVEDTAVNQIADLAAYVLAWRQVVYKRLYVTPYLYSNENYLADHNLSTPFINAGFKLWLAAWQPSNPVVPKGWTEVVWWQHDDKGSVPGVVGEVCLDWGIGL